MSEQFQIGDIVRFCDEFAVEKELRGRVRGIWQDGTIWLKFEGSFMLVAPELLEVYTPPEYKVGDEVRVIGWTRIYKIGTVPPSGIFDIYGPNGEYISINVDRLELAAE